MPAAQLLRRPGRHWAGRVLPWVGTRSCRAGLPAYLCRPGCSGRPAPWAAEVCRQPRPAASSLQPRKVTPKAHGTKGGDSEHPGQREYADSPARQLRVPAPRPRSNRAGGPARPGKGAGQSPPPWAAAPPPPWGRGEGPPVSAWTIEPGISRLNLEANLDYPKTAEIRSVCYAARGKGTRFHPGKPHRATGSDIEHRGGRRRRRRRRRSDDLAQESRAGAGAGDEGKTTAGLEAAPRGLLSPLPRTPPRQAQPSPSTGGGGAGCGGGSSAKN